MSRTVTVNDEPGAVDILKDFIGHTLKDVSVDNGTHTAELPLKVNLTFSDEPACGILDAEEQEVAFGCWEEASEDMQIDRYKRLHKLLTNRIAEVGPFE